MVHIHVREAATSAGPSKKTTKKAATKTVGSRTTSGRGKQAVVQIQETARSLYDADEYMGSFSDEEQDAVIDPLNEEDDIVDAPSPEPKPWPPVRTTTGKTAPTTRTIADAPADTSDEDKLFKDLMAVRKEVQYSPNNDRYRCLTSIQISRKHKITDEEDIFDQDFLFSLSLIPPQGLYHDWLGSIMLINDFMQTVRASKE